MGLYSREDTKIFLRERVARPASAGVIITNNHDEALLLKAHYKPYWSFPGGWIEKEQTPLAAAIRELEEETNVSIDQEQLTFAFILNRVSDIMQSYQFVFESNMNLEDGYDIIPQASEIDDWRFVSREEVLKDKDSYGGAVVLWAENTNAGYYEQEVRI